MSVNSPIDRALLDMSAANEDHIMPRGDGDRDREREARKAATLIYNASTESHQSPLISSVDVNSGSSSLHPHRVMEDQLPSVQSSFSAIRRVFCLLATFDLILIAVLWFIYIQLVGLEITKGFNCQVDKYNFSTSLFDIVAMAFLRMVILLFAYALFRSKHWIFAAFTTIATTALIIAKIFLYKFTTSEGYPPGCKPHGMDDGLMSIVMIICSLLVAWLELWVLDFQVLPKEKKLLEEALIARNLETSERAPLLGPANHQRYDLPGGQHFYSPYDSPRDSDSESINSEVSSESFKSSRTADFQSLPNSQRGSTVDLAATTREQEYVQKAKDALVQLQGILDNEEIWKKESAEDEACVYCASYPGIPQRIYKVEAILPASVETMLELMWHKVHESVTWNGAVLAVERVQEINEFVDILYSVAAPGGKGVVSSRDFVSVRLCEQRGERYVSSAISIEHPDKPPVQEYVRGENGVSGWVLEPVPDRPGHCKYVWIVNSNLKLRVWTPHNILDPVMAGVLLESYRDLHKHLVQMQNIVIL